MAGGISDAYEKILLDKLFSSADFTPPATLYFALLTDTNTSIQRAAGTVTEVATGVWTNYARIGQTNNATNFAAATGVTASKTNATAVAFGTAAITGTAPVVTAIAVYSALTAGTLVSVFPLTASQTINNGNVVSVAVGAWTLTISETA